MPGYITHYTFAVQAYKNSTEATLKQDIRSHTAAYVLGAQGPDIFFYYVTNLNAKKLGSFLHKQKTGEFLQYCVLSLRNVSNPKERSIVRAFVSGLLCHYILDTTCHPYVYGLTNKQAYDEKAAKQYLAYHCSFESELDNQVYDYYFHKKSSQIKQYETMNVTMTEQRVIAEFYSKMINHIYHETLTAKQIRNAIRHMHIELRLLHDPHGYKKPLVVKLENLFLDYPILSCMIPTTKCTHPMHCLNLDHSTWECPFTNEEHNTSFIDLFEQSLDKAKTIFDLVTDGSASNEILKNHIPDLSYNSGLPV